MLNTLFDDDNSLEEDEFLIDGIFDAREIKERDLKDVIKKYRSLTVEPVLFNAGWSSTVDFSISRVAYIEQALLLGDIISHPDAAKLYVGCSASAYIKLNPMWVSLLHRVASPGLMLDGTLNGVDTYKYPPINNIDNGILNRMIFVIDKNDNVIKAIELENLRG